MVYFLRMSGCRLVRAFRCSCSGWKGGLNMEFDVYLYDCTVEVNALDNSPLHRSSSHLNKPHRLWSGRATLYADLVQYWPEEKRRRCRSGLLGCSKTFWSPQNNLKYSTRTQKERAPWKSAIHLLSTIASQTRPLLNFVLGTKQPPQVLCPWFFYLAATCLSKTRCWLHLQPL